MNSKKPRSGSGRSGNAQMVTLRVRCESHGEHTVYLASIDGMAEQVACFFADRAPFDCEVLADELPLILFAGGPLGSDHR
jgi:hypothetical protein